MSPARLVPLALVVIGSAATAAAVGADILRVGGGSGFGVKQTILVGIGGALVGIGVLLATPIGRRYRLAVAGIAADDRPVPILALAVGYGMAVGLVEPLITWVRIIFRGEAMKTSHSYVWMAPLAGMLFFGMLAIALYLLGRRWPKLASPQAGVLVFTFFTVMAVLRLFAKGLESYAVVLLAAGIALAGARWVALHAGHSPGSRGVPWAGASCSESPRRWTRPAFPSSLLAEETSLSAPGRRWPPWPLASRACSGLGERRTLAALPRPAAKAPNVLVQRVRRIIA